jgi:acetyl esterase
MLDPQARAFLEQLRASGRPQIHELPPEEGRGLSTALTAQLSGPPQAVASVRDLAIPGAGGTIPARLYVPAGTATVDASSAQGARLPVLVYFHGGGFVVGSVAGWDPLMRMLANASGCAIVSVDYRLAPEHKFPAAVDDAYAAVAWVAREAESLGCDPERIAVGGDSAGGNLAAVTALLARDRGGPKIAFQLLVYPVTDRDHTRRSHREFGEGHFLTSDMMRWFTAQYTTPEAGFDVRLFPLHAETLRGLPPAHVIVAECDPLRDEGEAYYERLKAEGVPATFAEYPGMIHGFFTFPAVLDLGRKAVEDAGAVLSRTFGTQPAFSQTAAALGD